MSLDTQWESEIMAQIRGVPFPSYRLRSQPNVDGFWWVDRWNNGHWKVVQVFVNEDAALICGSDDTHPFHEFKGKWVGPIAPTQFGV